MYLAGSQTHQSDSLQQGLQSPQSRYQLPNALATHQQALAKMLNSR